MMLKFNNAHDDHRGNVIYINEDHIVAVYEQAWAPGGSLRTQIVGITGIVWTVEESPKQVLHIINHKMLVE
jgi:hypothetical protein